MIPWGSQSALALDSLLLKGPRPIGWDKPRIGMWDGLFTTVPLPA